MPDDWLPVPHYKQSADGQCLPACVRMVLAYLGRDLTEGGAGLCGVLAAQERTSTAAPVP